MAGELAHLKDHGAEVVPGGSERVNGPQIARDAERVHVGGTFARVAALDVEGVDQGIGGFFIFSAAKRRGHADALIGFCGFESREEVFHFWLTSLGGGAQDKRRKDDEHFLHPGSIPGSRRSVEPRGMKLFWGVNRLVSAGTKVPQEDE